MEEVEKNHSKAGGLLVRNVTILLVAAVLLLAPSHSSAIKLTFRTTDMVNDLLALEGLEQLVNFIGGAGVNITHLENALNQHQLHQEGPDAAGLFVESDKIASTFLPHRQFPKKNSLTPYNFAVVIVDDADTHALLRQDVIDDLSDGQFLVPGNPYDLRETADTALHELVHAMIFRTRCFNGNNKEEEKLVGEGLMLDIRTKVQAHLFLQGGLTTAAVNFYQALVNSVANNLKAHKNWTDCYETLGLPGSFDPTPPVVQWLSFVQGDPGVPGDGIFVKDKISSGKFDTSPTFSLAGVTSGLTVTIFPSKNVPIDASTQIFLDVRISDLPECGFARLQSQTEFPLCSAPVVASFINGVPGMAMSCSQASIALVVAGLSIIPPPKPSCYIQPPSDRIVISAVGLFKYGPSNEVILIDKVDAAAIGYGENAFPTETEP